jgi:hypothetical protein
MVPKAVQQFSTVCEYSTGLINILLVIIKITFQIDIECESHLLFKEFVDENFHGKFLLSYHYLKQVIKMIST